MLDWTPIATNDKDEPATAALIGANVVLKLGQGDGATLTNVPFASPAEAARWIREHALPAGAVAG